MLKGLFHIIYILFSILIIYSCGDYCDFEFSEDYFPLEVGNTWEYSDLNSRGSYNKWEVVDSINESGIEKYIISWSGETGEAWRTYLIYFSDKKLYTNMPLAGFWYYNEEITSEYILADFSKNKGGKFSTIAGDGIIVSNSHNEVIIGYIPESYEHDYWGFEITFEKGRGITELDDPVTWHSDKIQLINYSLN